MMHRRGLSCACLFCRSFVLAVVFLLSFASVSHAVDGSQLWLTPFGNSKVKVRIAGKQSLLQVAKEELEKGWNGQDGVIVTLRVSKAVGLKKDGYRLNSGEIVSNTPQGVLYGVFDYLRRQQLGESLNNVVSNPSYQYRLLNHWDNQNGSIERGYAGKSIFWRNGSNQFIVTNEDKIRWKMYARANASVGINGAVLNNVNANPTILDTSCLRRAAAIADVLRPYGVRVYLSINFSSPARLGGLKSSDPLDAGVIAWWRTKVKEVYKLIPDFGGFLVKANSEGQPGPQDYGRTHADGANMLADALKPYGGIVMWRAFVYSPQDEDRAKQAYNEFVPLDGKFRDNVILQVKNGPIDFQPREPFNPLFGALTKTGIMPELQITQEYLGHSYQLVYLSTMWEELLKSDTYLRGQGSTVARCTDGSLFPQRLTAISGVSNIGLDTTWCGNIFAPSNWYAFGRLAWNNTLTSEQIAMEWLQQTFKPEINTSNVGDRSVRLNEFLKPVCQMMLDTREATVDYMMPLGLHHIFSANEHYGPGPWYGSARVRKDWTCVYYHKAEVGGIGFDRTDKGSNAVAQYNEPLASIYNDLKKCPENLLLWFHHVPWTYQMKSGKSLWDELCTKYDTGVRSVRDFQRVWDRMYLYVDKERFASVQKLLRRHVRDAQIWKDACILYFQQFSSMPIPYEVERPMYDLDFLMKMNTLQPYSTAPTRPAQNVPFRQSASQNQQNQR
jgi:alpha-glucuronidase